jgi:hypothetical protein
VAIHRRLRTRRGLRCSCSTEARFADTHARVGVMPGWVFGEAVARHQPSLEGELFLSGNFLSAAQASDLGLVNRVVRARRTRRPRRRALAVDMLSTGSRTCSWPTRKSIDDGFAAAFGHGVLIERDRATSANAQVSSDLVEQARTAGAGPGPLAEPLSDADAPSRHDGTAAGTRASELPPIFHRPARSRSAWPACAPRRRPTWLAYRLTGIGRRARAGGIRLDRTDDLHFAAGRRAGRSVPAQAPW